MGIDAEIVIGLKEKPDEKFINRMKNLIQDCFPIDGNLFEDDGYHIDNPERFKAIYGLSSLSRYYGEGYERGPFLSIYGVLKYLRKAFNDYAPTIFYSVDCNDTYSEITDKELEDLMDHFIKVGESPYRDHDYDLPYKPRRED